MNFFRRKPKIEGEIGYFGLAEWWLSTFTDQERAYIEKDNDPLAGEEGSLTRGKITFMSQTAGMFLSGLSSWFKKTEQDRSIAKRILIKACRVE